MTTELRTQTPAEARKIKAEERIQQLRDEQQRVRERLQEASETLAIMQQEIVLRERAGDDMKALQTLRRQRTELQDVVADLNQVLPAIAKEIEPVAAELQEAERVMCAEQYNTLVDQQRELTRTLAEALSAFLTQLTTTLAAKRTLAAQQARLQHEWGVPHAGPTPENLCAVYVREASATLDLRLLNPKAVSNDDTAEQLDWSIRAMNVLGALEPMKRTIR